MDKSLTWFPPFKTLSIPGVLIVKHQFYADDHSVYDKLGTDAYVVLHMIPLGARMFVADANAIKDITTARTTFTKPVIQYETLDIFGNNMLSSEGHAWTRYRKASISSFSERNLQCVCESSVRIMQEIFTTWSGRSEIRMSDTKDWTLKIALHVLSAAGFGMATTWDETLDSDVDRSFQVAVTETLEQFLWRLILPKWAFGTKADRDAVAIAGLVGNGWLGKKPQKAALVFSNLDRCLRQMIDGRQAAGIGENERDLMSNLIRANTEEDGDEVPLSLREVMGNMFVFLMAGHETVGHTLAFMFGLLALDPEEQDRLYEHIKSVLGDRDLTYHDIHSLSRVFAVVNETLRLYPPLFIILKECTTDATVNIRMTGPKATEETKTVAVVPGTWISINTTAVSYDRSITGTRHHLPSLLGGPALMYWSQVYMLRN
ncbi:hypothetical protein FRB97_000678 [Tulasnella sp. 331]|nr:hypothetical protein FRB97_000678 [Tulasnella sp. 331]KAG8884501.1 hypothetical protein FRB98_002364 [Tulasnella sp. 332]